MTAPPRPPFALLCEPLLRSALAEDLGRAGDLTSDAVLEAGSESRARLVARRAGTIAGLPLVSEVYRLLDARVEVEAQAVDGERVGSGARLARLAGPSHALLAGERTALNLLGHLSGVATATRALVDAVEGTAAKIVCTRKTTPGLRALEKYAVRCGGGANHRFGLDDAVLVKDNHLVAAGGVRAAVERARGRVGHLVKIEVEVQTLEDLDAALAAGVDAVLLDNMDLPTLAAAVHRVGGRVPTEASGGVTLETVRAIAATGVDLISVGWITHSAPSLDVALDFES